MPPADASIRKRVAILGTRGIPPAHGGFETFAERLALYLKSRQWDVTVYCHDEGPGQPTTDEYQGIHLVRIPVAVPGPLGTILFDWKSALHASGHDTVILTLGYNTAVFSAIYRVRGRINLINMDGMEWKRRRWNKLQRAWLYLNERAGCYLANHLIADHPAICDHLATRVARRKISTIVYGSDPIGASDATLLEPFGLTAANYALVVARSVPDNSIREIVTAFSRKQRATKLVLVGHYDPETNAFHREVMECASTDVIFVGPIYEKNQVQALRFYAKLYIHGHRVGGTNPSLVEALGAGNAVLAHDNPFNRWVAGPKAHFFKTEDDCSSELDLLLDNEDELSAMRAASLNQHRDRFQWQGVLSQYESLLLRVQAGASVVAFEPANSADLLPAEDVQDSTSDGISAK